MTAETMSDVVGSLQVIYTVLTMRTTRSPCLEKCTFPPPPNCSPSPLSSTSSPPRAIETIDRGRWFANEEQIACVTITDDTDDSETTSSTCALLQNTGGAWGSRILELAHYLEGHRCKGCGSVPYFYPGDHNVSHGELTYNTVNRPCSYRDGLCYMTTVSSAGGRVNITMLCIMSFLRVAWLIYRWT